MDTAAPLAALALAFTLLDAAPAGAQQVLSSHAGRAAGDRFGAAVGAAGDVDGDGRDDWVVGVPYADGPFMNCGRALVYSGATGALLFEHRGSDHNVAAGYAVCGLGDVNGDGFDDIAIGMPLVGPGGIGGVVRVLAGPNGALLREIPGLGVNYGFGWVVAAAGDCDGDGLGDLIIGAPYADTPLVRSGLARVVSPATGATLFTLVGNVADEQLGSSVAGIGDFDGDGRDDVAVGAPGAAPSGRVRVHSGANGAVLADLAAPANTARFGRSLSGPGDLDGDGVPDLFIGGDLRAHALSGATGASLFAFTGNSVPFGYERQLVANAGDLDLDGVQDLVLGSDWADDNGIPQGSFVRFVSGRTGTQLGRIDGTDPRHEFGGAVGGARDLDGDGAPEVLIGAPGRDDAVALGGEVTVYTFPPVVHYCAGGPNSTGLPGLLTTVGSHVVQDNDLRLCASQLPPNVTVFFLGSRLRGQVLVGGGTLCLGGAIGRYVGPGQIQHSGPQGAADLQLDLNGLATPTGPVAGLAGEYWHFQAWHRDLVLGFPSSGLTGAVTVGLREP